MKHHRFIYALLVLVSFCSCKISQTYVANKHLNWEQQHPSAGAQLSYQVFLIGDAGEAKAADKDAVLGLLKSKMSQADSNSAVVYLGDNIYEGGLPDTADPKRANALGKINAQLNIIKGFKGHPVFVPGNHDWGYSIKEAHSDRIKRENDYVKQYLGRNDVFFPEQGCPGPVLVPLKDNLALIAIDPDWLLESGYRVGTTCGNVDEAAFQQQLNTVVSANKGKNILMVAHQPLFSTGPHSGYSGWKPHIFPLTVFNKYLYVPLPILGSIYAIVRASGLSHQDLHNKHYQQYVNTVLQATANTPNVVFAAGHEHTLEYFEHDNNLHEVLSGAGSKLSNIKKTKKLGFGGHYKGFAVINYYTNGEAWVEYWASSTQKADGTLLFHTKMYNKQ